VEDRISWDWSSLGKPPRDDGDRVGWGRESASRDRLPDGADASLTICSVRLSEEPMSVMHNHLSRTGGLYTGKPRRPKLEKRQNPRACSLFVLLAFAGTATYCSGTQLRSGWGTALQAHLEMGISAASWSGRESASRDPLPDGADASLTICS
jgi:hypothetical protein